ncbi:unnamed protein product [Vitrella brassicaformis CCMP3155]|uniref:Large ribosomal subunit protein uL15/eL18 domain-containing protein n=1 Tax=Vitrella brassicaformis (strain CCMP3155) TaxID=1169540 RepID=A0A0G4GY70_VITBC|nr:unnamed protein product [Vitrella brassicaformis CCMP3155]|eukprot:CEM36032.1 unnamed protein product [Vitrella brassicaformis CCMP3155]
MRISPGSDNGRGSLNETAMKALHSRVITAPLLPSFCPSPAAATSAPPRVAARCVSSLASTIGAPPFGSRSAFFAASPKRLQHVEWWRSYHTDQQFNDGETGQFRPHPFNRRFAFSNRPFFPIEPRNIRRKGLKRGHKKIGRGKNWRGIVYKHDSAPHYRQGARTFEGGNTPLFKRLPKWPEAWMQRRRKGLDPLSLAKLREWIERGLLDTRFPITQRHLHESRCCRVKRGVRLFNYNDYPFPYKIDIEVAGADQSSIDMINKVGGSINITYRTRVTLRAHLRPYKFEVLPKTPRPNLKWVHYLEVMRARGCKVRYIKPMWLLQEEQRVRTELAEFDAEVAAADGMAIPPAQQLMLAAGGDAAATGGERKPELWRKGFGGIPLYDDPNVKYRGARRGGPEGLGFLNRGKAEFRYKRSLFGEPRLR